MGFKPGMKIIGHPVDYVFMGSCTNGRIEDLRAFANLVKGRRRASNVTALIVPGSKKVEKQAIEEGIDVILRDAGFNLRGNTPFQRRTETLKVDRVRVHVRFLRALLLPLPLPLPEE
jgi:aconitase B